MVCCVCVQETEKTREYYFTHTVRNTAFSFLLYSGKESHCTHWLTCEFCLAFHIRIIKLYSLTNSFTDKCDVNALSLYLCALTNSRFTICRMPTPKQYGDVIASRDFVQRSVSKNFLDVPYAAAAAAAASLLAWYRNRFVAASRCISTCTVLHGWAASVGAARHGHGGGNCLPLEMHKWVVVTVTNCTLEYLNRQ